MLVDDGADDIGATAAAAYTVHHGRADAIDDTAGDAGQHRIMDVRRFFGQEMECVQRNGKDQHTIQGAAAVSTIHKFISRYKKWDV